jgi:DNA sulfur modification protein DndD
MKIQLIELENYRQYRGKVSIELCCDSARNFTVFQGVNGSGKTNMLNAVEWCLYNREDHLSKYASKRQPIINDAELRELVKGQKIYARVTLKMTDEKDNNRFYQFDRRIGAKRLDNGRVEFDGQSEFHCYMQIGKDIKEIRETEILINRILPHGVKSFFFFDGEQLDDFFKEEKSAKVRDAIFDVSQLDLLDRTIEHLEKTISSIRGEVKGESPKVDEITEKIKEVEKGLENSKQMKKEKEDKLKEIRSKLKEIEDKLGDSNESIVKALQSQREKLENRLEQVEGSIEENKERAINNLIEVGPFICGFDALQNAVRQIEGKVVKGDIPPKIKQTFVSELLQKGECICGTDVTTNSKARQKLEELLNGVKISEIYEEIIQLKFQLNPMMSKVEGFIDGQDTIRKKIKNLEEEKEKIKTELQEVSTKLQGINVEEITNLEITRGKLKQELESLSRDIGVFDEKIKNARLFLEKCQRDLNEELRKSHKFAEVNEKLKLAIETSNVLNTIRQKLINDIRNAIQEKTKDNFLRLVWKKETYDNVTIDDNYSISVINRVGSECLGSLSAGERQILALSFLAALREISGFSAPIIIDTPLGRISKEPKENVAELLPEFLKDAQVTMFMTEEEYTPRVRQLLAKRVGKEYELCYDESMLQTVVKPYGE